MATGEGPRGRPAETASPSAGVHREIRIRRTGRVANEVEAKRNGHEVVSLWLNGPPGGGGATHKGLRGDRDRLGVPSTRTDRHRIDYLKV